MPVNESSALQCGKTSVRVFGGPLSGGRKVLMLLNVQGDLQQADASLDCPSVSLDARAVLGLPAGATLRPAQHYQDLGSSSSLPPKLERDTCGVKPSARAHTAAPHCGSHCHQLRVFV